MNADIIVIGGAAMGAATAHHLARLDPAASVVVIERDATYAQSSTALSDGNSRVQFNLRENIEMSLYLYDVFETFSDDTEVDGRRYDLAPRRQGNLFFTTEDGRAEAEAGLADQRALGGRTEWLSSDEIVARWPAFRSPPSIGGTYGPDDGTIDPNALMSGFRAKATSRGVAFVEATVTGISVADGAVTGVRLDDGTAVTAEVVVACAGAWTPALVRPLGIELPVEPIMRTVYVIDTEVDADGVPSVFAPSGVYVMPESGRRFIVGWSTPDDPVGFDFTFRRDRFERVWAELYEWFPAFEALHLAGGWSGLYAVNTFDGNGIFGAWPDIGGLYVCTGFSGHGLQQAPAVGRYLAESILGAPLSLDLTRLGPERLTAGVRMAEHGGRLI